MNGPKLDRMPGRYLFARTLADIAMRNRWLERRDLRVTAQQLCAERTRRRNAAANKKGNTK